MAILAAYPAGIMQAWTIWNTDLEHFTKKHIHVNLIIYIDKKHYLKNIFVIVSLFPTSHDVSIDCKKLKIKLKLIFLTLINTSQRKPVGGRLLFWIQN